MSECAAGPYLWGRRQNSDLGRAIELRDELAIERTRLANERTLLAYVRTALALAAAGAAILHFFADQPTIVAIAWILIVCALVLGIAGIGRFLLVRRRIESHP